MKYSIVDYAAMAAVAVSIVLLIVDAMPKFTTLIYSMVV